MVRSAPKSFPKVISQFRGGGGRFFFSFAGILTHDVVPGVPNRVYFFTLTRFQYHKNPKIVIFCGFLRYELVRLINTKARYQEFIIYIFIYLCIRSIHKFVYIIILRLYIYIYVFKLFF